MGDCFNGEGADDEEIADVAAVPCSEPHDDEVFHSFTLPEGEWPGADAILMEAEIECMEQFETFAGIAHEVSALDFYPITPTEPGWNTLDDREILCLIYDFEGQSSGTLKGAGR